MIWLLTLSAMASPQWSQLRSDGGWEHVATKKSSVGPVTVRSKAIDGMTCLEGDAKVRASARAMLDVADDMGSAGSWSSANLAESTELSRDADGFVLYQYLDLPAWTMTADRYWVIRGHVDHHGAGGRYSWDRASGAEFANVHEQAKRRSTSSLEPPVNFGEWTFSPEDTGARVRYRSCADFGGSVPDMVTSWLATTQVPQTLADLAQEAARRQADGR
jgi:hypothetical protein